MMPRTFPFEPVLGFLLHSVSVKAQKTANRTRRLYVGSIFSQEYVP